jgi:hypothetical protein
MGSDWEIVEPGVVDILDGKTTRIRLHFSADLLEYKSDLTAGTREEKSGKFLGRIKK